MELSVFYTFSFVNFCAQEPIQFVETGGNSEPRMGREGKRARVSFGFAKVKGRRKITIEDFHVARIQEVDNQEIGLFAIMDGHGGPDVAVYLTDNIFEVITTHADFWNDPKKSIIEAYHETDKRSAPVLHYVLLSRFSIWLLF